MSYRYPWMHPLRDAFNFFRENAGGIVGENAKTALALARAEAEARRIGLVFSWEPETEAHHDVFGDMPCCERAKRFAAWARTNNIEVIGGRARYWAAKEAAQHTHDPCEVCIVYASEHDREPGGICNLGMIEGATKEYRRVVEAELACEALRIIDERRVYPGAHVEGSRI